jgi:subtilisin family serine protease
MKSFVALTLFVAFACAANLLVVDPRDYIENQYVVVFKDGVTDDQRADHMKTVYQNFAEEAEFENEVFGTFKIVDFAGFTARLSPSMLQTQLDSPLVEYVEQDQVYKATQSCSQQTGATWGIDRVAEKTILLDGNYRYSSTAGSGVDAYIIDTGININHNDFGGRAIWGANFVDSNNQDCNGHGTHVAGTVGGTKYGVAKKSTLIAVKVLNCAGSGSTTGIINAVNWVVSSKNSRKRPSVANMSLGGGFSSSLNSAVNSAVSAGITFAVASGNDNQNSCNYSPASATSSISVGATGVDEQGSSQVDERASFSNYGSCTHIFAPGYLITSDWIGSNSATNTISGTSMASPHVCGVAAVYLGDHTTATPASIKSWMINGANANMIRLDCTGALSPSSCNQSPNKLVYNPC